MHNHYLFLEEASEQIVRDRKYPMLLSYEYAFVLAYIIVRSFHTKCFILQTSYFTETGTESKTLI